MWLTNTLFYEYITFYLSIHLLMDIWVASTLTIMNNTVKNIHIHAFISHGHVPSSGISGSNSNTVFEIVKSYQAIFQSGSTILNSNFCTSHGHPTRFGATHSSTHMEPFFSFCKGSPGLPAKVLSVRFLPIRCGKSKCIPHLNP